MGEDYQQLTVHPLGPQVGLREQHGREIPNLLRSKTMATGKEQNGHGKLLLLLPFRKTFIHDYILTIFNYAKPSSGTCTSKKPILIKQNHNMNLIHRYLYLSHVHQCLKSEFGILFIKDSIIRQWFYFLYYRNAHYLPPPMFI